MNNYVIALCGKARSGKNTAAQMISNHLVDSQCKVHELSFAAELKSLARKLFRWSGDKTMYSVDIKDQGRNLLINIGKAMRDIRPSVWVDFIANMIDEICITTDNNVFMITDARFKNELLVLNETSADRVITIRLNRTSGGEDIDDPSEKDLDGHTFDYTIEAAGGDLDAINQQLYLILEQEGLV